MDKIFEITAKAVTIQVKDERTGVEYSRTLPIDYYENANVLRLSGENLDGAVLLLFSIPPEEWNDSKI